MMRSMFSGVSGMRNHQTKMDVIGNNIANVNTYGYKMSRVAFQEMYNQTLKSASAGNASLGGTNPMQIGLGVSAASIDVIHEGSGFQTTDRALDFAIQGDGFFTVQQNENTFYTRAGNFYLDDQGFMVTSNGMYVQGICLLDDVYLTNVDQTHLKTMTPDDLEVLTDIDYDQHVGRLVIPDDFASFTVNDKGLISGMDKQGNLVPVGQLVLTTFKNPPGLSREGANLYQRSNNSGDPVAKVPGTIGTGTLKPGSLEMSNVDLSKEFTDMIITQRGFQANSRVITVSDTLLEELINLKR